LALSVLETDDGSTGGITFTSVSSGWTEDQTAQPSYHTTYASSRDALTTDTTTGISNVYTLSGSPTTPVAATVLIKPAASSGSIMSPAVSFSSLYGAASWGSASWSETETNGTVSMQLYYTASTACDTIVPDSALTGNSSGFATGPVSISGLSTSTYSQLCLKATLVYSSGTPYLNDWTIAQSGAVVSITISDGVVSYGTVAVNTSRNTCTGGLNDAQTVTNNGNVAEDFTIKGSNSANWTLGASAGSNQYMHEFKNGSCSTFTGGTALTTTDQTFATNIAASGTATLNLQLTSPSSTTSYVQQSVNVTVTATQH
jgi:hypothetical protein